MCFGEKKPIPLPFCSGKQNAQSLEANPHRKRIEIHPKLRKRIAIDVSQFVHSIQDEFQLVSDVNRPFVWKALSSHSHRRVNTVNQPDAQRQATKQLAVAGLFTQVRLCTANWTKYISIMWWNAPVMQGMSRLHPQGYPRSSPIA